MPQENSVTLTSFQQGQIDGAWVPEPWATRLIKEGGAKILVKVKEGIEVEKARVLVQAIKDAKLKVQAGMQEAQVRVTGKNKDDLQKTMQLVRGLDLGIEMQFLNFRD